MTELNKLPSKLEAACVAVASAIGLSGTVVAGGMADGTLSHPAIVCSVQEGSQEEIRDSGIFRFRVSITTKSSPDDGTDITIHQSRMGQVADAFLDSDIAATLSAQVPDFHVYDVQFSGWVSDREDRSWLVGLELDVLCCATDIT